jgi:hypothetical protein
VIWQSAQSRSILGPWRSTCAPSIRAQRDGISPHTCLMTISPCMTPPPTLAIYNDPAAPTRGGKNREDWLVAAAATRAPRARYRIAAPPPATPRTRGTGELTCPCVLDEGTRRHQSCATHTHTHMRASVVWRALTRGGARGGGARNEVKVGTQQHACVPAKDVNHGPRSCREGAAGAGGS